jgi:hypothetical protein
MLIAYIDRFQQLNCRKTFGAMQTLKKRFTRSLAAASLLCLAITGCGSGGNSNSTPAVTAGPQAILNGNSLTTATSYWVGSNCALKVEVAADGGLWSYVADSSGSKTTAGETWTASGTNGLVTSGALGAPFVISKLTNISGSTSSGKFTAGATVVDSSSTEQVLGTCSFSLQNGKMPGT